MRMSVHPGASCLLLHCIVLLDFVCVRVCVHVCVCKQHAVQMKTNSHVEKKVCVLQTENQEKSLQINDTF